MSVAKVNLPEFRISLAAVGRRLSSVLLRANKGEISKDDFFDTINAVFKSCVSEDYTPDPEAIIDSDVLAAELAEVEKSARRSAAARRAAERRRRMREVQEKSSEFVTGTTQSYAETVATVSPQEEPTEEPKEIYKSKYDAYGARRIWY